MTYPLVSIIMPVYNSEKYLNKNIESIAKQSYENIEVILVDDGSTDSSLEIMKSFERKDKRISSITQSNQGAPAARNNGIRESKGDYILFVDSDDLMAPKSVENLVSSALSNRSDLVIGQFKEMDEDDKFFSKKLSDSTERNFKVEASLDNLFFIPALPGNKLYKSSIIKENNVLFESLKRAQDLNFYLRFLFFAEKVTCIPQIVYYYRHRSNSISHTVSPVILETIKSIENVEVFYKKNKKYNETIFNSLKFKYYTDQLSKIPQIENRNTRKNVYEIFSEKLKQLDFENVLPFIENKKIIVTKLKLLLPGLYTSECYSSYQSKKIQQKNLDKFI